MNLKNRLVLLAIAVMFCFQAFGTISAHAQVNKLGEILRRMDAHNQALKTLRAEITMGKQNVQTGDEDIRIGKVIYAKQKGGDAFVRIDWSKPDDTIAF